MTKDWQPTSGQQSIIARTIEFISDELAELQEELDCPNSFITKIVDGIAYQYKANSKILRRDEE